MDEKEKIIEILLKIVSGNYTNFDELESLGQAIIEAYISNPNEKMMAKFMLSSAKNEAERRFNNDSMHNV